MKTDDETDRTIQTQNGKVEGVVEQEKGREKKERKTGKTPEEEKTISTHNVGQVAESETKRDIG